MSRIVIYPYHAPYIFFLTYSVYVSVFSIIQLSVLLLSSLRYSLYLSHPCFFFGKLQVKCCFFSQSSHHTARYLYAACIYDILSVASCNTMEICGSFFVFWIVWQVKRIDHIVSIVIIRQFLDIWHYNIINEHKFSINCSQHQMFLVV